MKTYTLWLEPTGRIHKLLATAIAQLSQEHGGPLFASQFHGDRTGRGTQ
jgi:hypothetical protein